MRKCNSTTYPMSPWLLFIIKTNVSNQSITSLISSHCTICPIGYKCQEGSTQPTPCTPYKEYSSVQGNSSCILCPSGYQCPDTKNIPIKCQDGYYSRESEGVCYPCPGGYSCLSSNLAPVPCQRGYYSEKGEASCEICPRGYECGNNEVATMCKEGYYSNEGATSCTICPAGFKCEKAYFYPVKCLTPKEFSLPGSIHCEKCPEDHECAISEQAPQPCGGNMQAKQGQGLCRKFVGVEVEVEVKQQEIFAQRNLQVTCSAGQYKNDSGTCVACPAGFDCNDGHYYLRTCPPGSYSLINELSCTVCPSGSMCPSASAGPTACDAGQFSLAGQISCTECPPGFQCPNKLGTSIEFCLSGKYSTGKQQACQDCPIDKYCNAFEAIDCNTVMYSPLGDYNCYWCPPGYSCNKTLGTKTACASGQYSLERSLTCTQCPAGFRCPDIGAAPYPCEPNTYSSTRSTTCTACAAGQYSFIGWSACSTLPAGYFVSSEALAVPQIVQFGKYTSDGRSTADCAAGKVCGEGASSATGDRNCPAGHYCKAQNNFVGIYPCPEGTYKSTESVAASSSTCLACPAGKYCPPGTITPKDCQPGYYCDAGTKYATQTPCPNDKWSNANASASSSCFDCPDGYKCFEGIKNFCQPGHYCKGTVTQCPEGTYQPYIRKTVVSECLTCPKGHYCDATKMHTPKPCLAGTYNHLTGQNNVNACKQCAGGSVCPHPMTKYQNDGTVTPKRFPCQPGHYCPANSQNPLANPCPAHYYTDRTDLKDQSQCSRCPQGFWCPQGATFFGQASKNVLNVDANPGNKPILCPEGWYCPLNGDAVKCPAGSWNPTRGAFDLNYCKPCPAGYTCGLGTGSKPTLCTTHSYCPPGSITPISCPAGTYSPHNGVIWPNYMAAGDVADCFANHPGKYGRNVQCPVNQYNPFFWGSTADANVDNRGCWQTPEGFSTNSLTGQIVPSPCPIGKYSARGSDCQNCPPTYYCDELGLGQTVMQAERKCPDGYYCPGGATGERFPCPIGQFCNAGSSAPTNCSAGTWSFTIRQGGTACPAMIAGYYHQTVQHKAILCPEGKYCVGSNTQSNLASCPQGTFNAYLGAKSASYCVPCPIGFRCPNLATINPQICPQGSYCERGATSGTPCPAGTFSNSEGLKKLQDCIDCYAGSYCQGTGNTSSSSNKCTAGYLCKAKSTSPTQQQCPKYAYCPEGIPVQTNCLPGKYNSVLGKALETDCLTCPGGSYCTGTTDPQTCAAGYYCKSGSSTEFQNVAQVGYKAAAGDSDETICPGKRYNFDIGQSSCKRCPKGYMCTGGKLHDCYTQGTITGSTPDSDDNFNQYCGQSQVIGYCPAGTMNLFQNAEDSSACVPCLPGYKCNAGVVLKTQNVILTTDQYNGGKYGWRGTEYTTPAGFSTSTSTASYQFSCPAGAVQATTGNTSLACTPLGSNYASLGGYAYGVSCADGFQCISSSKHWNPAPCEIGYKCVLGVKTKCPAGQFQPIAGKSYCLPVKKGNYRGDTDATPVTCPAGSYCPQGASSPTACPEGFYNPATGRYKSDHCLKCNPGFFCAQGTSTLTTSQRCPAGKYCTIQAGTSYTGTCTAGHFCPEGSVYQQKCTPGSYCQTTNLGSVTNQCDPGYYCLLGATTKTPTNLATQGGEQCPAGTYCLAGSAIFTQCPPGTYSPTVGATQASDCLDCTAGKYCDKPKQTAVQGDCAAQFYCETKAISKFSKPCTAGSKCEAGSSAPADCLAQTPKGYQPKERSDFCITCPDGYTCTNIAKTECDYSASTAENKYCTNAAAVNCPDGKFIDFPGAGSVSDCLDCPPGLYCDNGSIKFQNCSGGVSCEGGQYAITGTGTAPDCPAGSYCPAGKRKLLCTAGSFCAVVKLISPSGACPAGYECPQGTVSGTTNPCPKGAYCPQGTAFGIKCPPGTYLDQTGKSLSTDCKDCAHLTVATGPAHCKGRGLIAPNASCLAGYYCDEKSITEYQHICPRGSYCPVNTKNNILCPINTYQAAQGQEICFNCPIGYDCNTTGRTTISICPTANQCPTAGAAKQACPAGTFGPKQGLSQCIPCTPGSFCTGGSNSVTGSCTAGHVCIGGAATATATTGGTGKVCPKGYYCQAGTMKELPCLPRTYGANTGLTSASACTDCPNGKYCPKYAMLDTEVTTSAFNCWAGYLCNDKSQIPNPTTTGGRKCRKGTFCTEGATVETKCGNGTYNALEGQSACVQCPKGFRCSWSTAALPTDISVSIDSVTPEACPAGKYCPAGSITGTDCPAGTYNDRTKISTAAQCKSCPPGKYCVAGSTGLSLPDCDAGYACPGGASTATPSSVYSKTNNPRINGQCPKGHKCPAGTSIPTPCERGKYQPSTTQSACIDCPQGKYCPQIGLWDASTLPSCADRFHCKAGAIISKPISGTTGNICQIGNYCLAGLQYQCVAGTFQNRQGSKLCQDCPAGYSCPLGASAPVQCTIGNYCPAKSPSPTVCPNGTINQSLTGLQKDSQCTPCPQGYYCVAGVKNTCDPGYYCKSGNSVANPVDSDTDDTNYTNGPCPVGHYCNNPTTKFPQPCATNTFRVTPGGAQASDCTTCPAGYFCPTGSNRSYPCPKGHYCPAGSSQPTACQFNSFNNQEIKDSSSFCILCNSSSYFGTTYCNGVSPQPPLISLDGYLCPVGYFCTGTLGNPSALSARQSCASGTFSAAPGAKDQCSACTGGSFCGLGTIVPTPCDAGYYCPAGSSSQTQCPAGSYCEENVSSFTTCPAAYYCPAGTITPIKCPNGTYCAAGQSAPTSCADGNYGTNNPNNISAATGCIQCDRGTFTEDNGVTECQQCTPGFVCTGGTVSSTPTNPLTDFGYICPIGHYCPLGSFKEKVCPAGTYNPSTGKSAQSDCLPCQVGTFNTITAQDGCQRCGSSATSVLRATECSCIGANRIYQQETGACICATGYTNKLGATVDSTTDCIPQVSDTCSSGQLKNQRNQCVSLTDCSATCGEGVSGTRIEGIGFCNCATVQDVDAVCNESCRNSQKKVTVKSNGMVSVNGGAQFNLLASVTGLIGEYSGCSTEDQQCKMVSIQVSASAGISASYSQHSALVDGRLLQQDNDRQLQTTTSSIKNPIVCIHTEDTFIFNIIISSNRAQSSYPIYVQSSLLNSDKNFDNSAFLKLQDRILNTSDNITFFAYQFEKSGLFVFSTSRAQSSYMVVRVLPQSQTCPNASQFIQPTTQENLYSIGVNKQVPTTSKSDWLIYGMMLLCFLIVLLGFFLLISIFHSKAIAREKSALLNQDEKEKTCCQRMFPCLLRRKRQAVGVGELQQQQLTLEELREIKELAADLKKRLIKLYDQKDDQFENVFKHARKLDRRLKNIADQYELKPEDGLMEIQERKRKNQFESGLGISMLEDQIKQENDNDEEEAEMRKKYEDKKFDDKIQKQVQQNVGQIEMELNQRHKNNVEDLRKNLDQRLAGMDDLTAEQKRQLLLEQQTNLAREENLLKAESKKQEDEMRRKLAERKAKRKLLQNKIDEEEQRKKQVEDNYQSDLNSEKERVEKDIRQLNDLDKLKEKQLKLLKKQFQQKREGIKDDMKELLQDRLNKTKVSQRPQLLEKFDQEQEGRMKKLEKQKKDREEMIKDNIEEIARQKKEQRKKEFEEAREMLMQERDLKMKDIDNEIERLGKLQQNEKVDEYLNKLDLLQEEKKRKQHLKMRRQHQKELKQLKRKQREALEKEDNEIKSSEMELEHASNDNKVIREQISKKQEKRQDLEKRFKELQDKTDPDSEKEKQRLLSELSQYDKALVQLEHDLNKQKSKIQEKLLLRKQKLKNKIQKRDEYDKDLEKMMDQQKEEDLNAKLQRLNQEFHIKLQRIQTDLEKEELTYAIEKLIDDKQAEELKILLAILLNEKFQKMKLILDKLFQNKLDELTIIKDEFRPKIEQLQDDKQKGRISSDQQYNQRFKQIKEEEVERKKDLDLKYFQIQNDAEEKVNSDLEYMHDKRIMQMKQKQIEEKNKYMKKMIARQSKYMKILQEQRKQAMQRQLQNYQNEMKRKLKQKLEEKEIQRAKLIQMSRQSQQRMRQFQQETHKANLQHQNRQRQRMEKRRADIEKRKNQVNNDLKSRTDLSQQMKKQLLKKHEQQMKQLQDALQNERKRQQDVMSMKLNDRRLLKQKKREEKDRKLMAYKLHKEQKIDKKLEEINIPISSNYKSQFEKASDAYIDNIKLFDKLKFPAMLKMREEAGEDKKKSRVKRSSIASSAERRSFSRERSSSYAFGAAGKRKKADLEVILARLCDIEEMLNRI